MLLQEIKIHNIRSYKDETITFPAGSTVLAGDIGTGKSSILLAVEFALFGASRPDLPAELLLRKGASEGWIELTFHLAGQDYIIKRFLKKEKDSIKQMPGYIIKNGMKKELMPIELKTEMISLLGYPEEFASKNKNYIFRYTVYTPQEEMKLILQENEEARLDVLRKIFNIDKYKIIRGNLQTYLKTLRSSITVCKTRIEPLEGLQEELKEITKNKLGVEENIKILLPQIQELEERNGKLKQELEGLEKQQKELQELQNSIKTTSLLLEEKEKSEKESSDKMENLTLSIQNLDIPKDVDPDWIREEMQNAEKEKKEFMQKKYSLQEKINFVQKSITGLQEEITKISEGTMAKGENQKRLAELNNAIKDKDSLLQKKEQLADLLEKTNTIIIRNKTILDQTKEIEDKVSHLETCPTCLQEVSEEHKTKIKEQEESKKQKAEALFLESENKKQAILLQQRSVEERLKEMQEKENYIVKIKTELEFLEKKEKESDAMQESLKNHIKENNSLMEELQKYSDTDVKKLDDKLEELQKILSAFTQKEFLEKQKQEILEQLRKLAEDIVELTKKKTEARSALEKHTDVSDKINEKKKEWEELQKKSKEVYEKKTQLDTQKGFYHEQEEKINTEIARLVEEKNKLVKLRELNYWLEQHLMKLTYTIEKHVMVHIHHLFNQLFQEWFSILIDDEAIHARIDDTFTPVIEQNGYEVGFSNLSGGEKTSASLAYRLALNRVINDVVNQIQTKELLILDEPTDGFSSEQLDKVRDVLDKLDLQQTIIVSHEAKIESFVENVIRVGKEGHVSRVY